MTFSFFFELTSVKLLSHSVKPCVKIHRLNISIGSLIVVELPSCLFTFSLSGTSCTRILKCEVHLAVFECACTLECFCLHNANEGKTFQLLLFHLVHGELCQKNSSARNECQGYAFRYIKIIKFCLENARWSFARQQAENRK